MSSIQNSKKFRERADLLQEQAALHGITMVPGEATELLANRLTAVAHQMGISARWALDNYVTDVFVISLVKAIAQQAKTYRPAGQDIRAATVPTCGSFKTELVTSHGWRPTTASRRTAGRTHSTSARASGSATGDAHDSGRCAVLLAARLHRPR